MAAVLAGDRGRLIEHGVSLCWEVRPVCYYTDVSAVSGAACPFIVGQGVFMDDGRMVWRQSVLNRIALRRCR